MLLGTLTQRCWRGLAYHEIVISICVAHLHFYRTCAMASETGVCSTMMCTRKFSVPLRGLHLAWRELITLRTGHKGRRDLAPQSRLRAAGSRPDGVLSTRVCLSWRKRAMFQSGGRAGLE